MNSYSRFPQAVCAAAFVLVSTFAAPAAAGADDLSDKLQPIAYRLGTWTATVEWLDADGKVVRTMPSIREVRTVMGGQGIVEEGRLLGTPTRAATLIYYDHDTNRITELGVQTPGRFDHFHVIVEEGKVTFMTEPREQNGQTVIFRAVDSKFTGDSYETSGWISRDHGQTWRQTFRQVNHRLDGQ